MGIGPAEEVDILRLWSSVAQGSISAQAQVNSYISNFRPLARVYRVITASSPTNCDESACKQLIQLDFFMALACVGRGLRAYSLLDLGTIAREGGHCINA